MKQETEPKYIEVVINKLDPSKEVLRHVIYCRCHSSLYGRVYYASRESGETISELVRMCIEKSLSEVVEDVKRKKSQVKQGRKT